MGKGGGVFGLRGEMLQVIEKKQRKRRGQTEARVKMKSGVSLGRTGKKRRKSFGCCSCRCGWQQRGSSYSWQLLDQSIRQRETLAVSKCIDFKYQITQVYFDLGQNGW